MDFTPRGDAHNQQGASTAKAASVASNKKAKKGSKLFRWGAVGLLFAIVILVVAVIISIALTDNKGQSQYVDKNNMQAVFLNGGQVYFGNIQSVNNDYMTVGNIYYLRVNQQVQPDGSTSGNGDVSLVKLGCELHGPQDQMVINNDQIVFWENLKSDGQVAKAVAEYVKQNPNGQDCNAQTQGQSNTNGTSNTNTNSTTNTNTNTNSTNR